MYADDFAKSGAYKVPHSDVWPQFLDRDGKELDPTVPLEGSLDAVMHIIFPEMVSVHLKRLERGTRFYCMEGSRRVAEGVVTELSA